MPLRFKSDLIAEVPRVLRTSSPVTFKWLLFPGSGRQAKQETVLAFIKAWLCSCRSSSCSLVETWCLMFWALGVINPGTHKEAFTAGCATGPLLMPAPVGRLRSCSRCFPLVCLHASDARQSKACYTYCIQYTMLQCAVAPWRKSGTQAC